MSSPYRYGCGVEMTVFVPRGYGYKEIKVRCGSTAHDGGVNQCEDCEKRHHIKPPDEDESDMDWFERQEGGDE